MEKASSYWQQLISYYQIFHEHISIWVLVKNILLFSVLFLTIGILLVIFCKKLIKTPRRHKSWKYITYIYFMAIPVWFLFCGFKFGLIHGLQSECKKATVKIMGNTDIYFKDFLTKNELAGNMTPGQIIDVSVGLIYLEYNGYLTEMSDEPGFVKQKLGQLLLAGIKSKFLSEMVKYELKEQIEKYTGIDKNMTGEVLTTRIRDFAQDGIFTKIIQIQIDVTFKGMKKGIFVLMFIVLLIPATEIIVARYLLKKDQANAALQ